MQLVLGDALPSLLRRARWPKDRELAFRIGIEFARAAADQRPPAAWALSALKDPWRKTRARGVKQPLKRAA